MYIRHPLVPFITPAVNKFFQGYHFSDLTVMNIFFAFMALPWKTEFKSNNGLEF